MNAHEQYQLLVGEVGIPRRDYLYMMPYWEILLVLRGYRRRDIPQLHMMRLQAFCSAFAFGGNKQNMTVEEFCPMWFDKHDEPDEELSDDEVEELRKMIEQENRAIEET